VKALTEKSWPM